MEPTDFAVVVSCQSVLSTWKHFTLFLALLAPVLGDKSGSELMPLSFGVVYQAPDEIGEVPAKQFPSILREM